MANSSSFVNHLSAQNSSLRQSSWKSIGLFYLERLYRKQTEQSSALMTGSELGQ